jgi:5'-nucleotidase
LASRERSRPCILVTNDDGHDAAGIEALVHALEPLGDLVVVAPETGVSGMSHALTLDRPVRARETGAGRFVVDGTPTDCVHLGVCNLSGDRRPSLVASGINRGLNLGDDVTYSGTVAGALEGALLGIPSVSFSMEVPERGEPPFERAAGFVRHLARKVLQHNLEQGVYLSVNFPARKNPAGVRVTRQGISSHRGAAEERVDPVGRRYFWIANGDEASGESLAEDRQAVRDGFVSVTPLRADWTAHAGVESLEGWNLDPAGGRG